MKILFAGLAAFSLVTTSLGGLIAPTAHAASLYGDLFMFSGNGHAGASAVGRVVREGTGTVFINIGGQPTYTLPSGTWVPQSPAPTPAPAPRPAPQPTPTPVSGISADEQQALSLLNADRAANGLAPLRLNSKLAGLARSYAQDMINRNYFSHNNPEGQSPFDRMRQAGISYGYAGENLAINVSVPAAENAFMNSPGHRANILNSHYTQVGVGVRRNSSGSVYVVQEFTDGQ